MRISILLVVLCLPATARAFSGDIVFRASEGAPARDGKDTRAVVFADVDGDGRLDLLAANFAQANNLYLNVGEGRWRPLENDPVVTEVARTTGAAFADVDGDGDEDLYLTRGHGERNALYINRGGAQGGTQGTFMAARACDGVTENGDSQAAAFGDLDGDGDQDLVVARRFQDDVVYWNDGIGRFWRDRDNPLGTAGGASRAVALGDLDGDGDLDIVIANSNGEDEFLYVNQGGRQGGRTGAFERRRDDPAASAGGDTFGLALGDLDGDDDLDLLLANRDEPGAVFLNDGAGHFHRGPSLPAPRDGAAEGGAALVNDSCGGVLADLDGDGDQDIVMAERRRACRLYVNDGGTFALRSGGALAGLAGDSRGLACGDIDGDGLPDLAVANGLGGDDFLLRNAGPQPVGAATAAGAPELSSEGELVADGVVSFACRGVPPGAACWLVIGRARLDAGLQGAALVPAPDLLLPGAPSPDGAVRWQGRWVGDESAALLAQCWIAFAGGAPCLASNALRVGTR